MACAWSASADDPVVSSEHRQAFEAEMRDGRVADWQLHVYVGVGHSFTNPRVTEIGLPGFAFDAAADRRSWRAMLDLFDETLRPRPDPDRPDRTPTDG